MARRIINKAYNDLVGGTGAEAPISLAPELPRKSSVLTLSSKDVVYGNRRAVEVKPVDGRPPSKGSQVAQTHRRDIVKPSETSGSSFVNIDGDGSVALANSNQEDVKTVPQTAYKMRSFMSAVDLDQRGARPTTQVNRSVKPPSQLQATVKPKITQLDDPKMFLPKGIHHTNQPYVVPKFMPPYREMMAPKPKPDPLVSIVEKTPPSLQKWAVEWNTEPKKTISIDELKEDLIRETGEMPLRIPGRNPKMAASHEFYAKEFRDRGKQKQPNANLENQPGYNEPEEKSHPNAPEGVALPWKDLQVPTSYETPRDQPNQPQPKIGQPLVDWVPPKYLSSSKGFDTRHSEYSFQEAIKNGTPPISAKPDTPRRHQMLFREPAEKTVHYDTEEQKFHEWFREKMSAVAHSAVKPCDTLAKNNQAGNQHKHSYGPPKQSGNAVIEVNARGHNEDEARAGNSNRRSQRNRPKDPDDLSVSEQRESHQPPEVASRKTAEKNSSFYAWLKQRGRHGYVVNNEPKPSEMKAEKEKPKPPQEVEFQSPPRFPWSVSFTARRTVSNPRMFPKTPTSKSNQSLKNVSQSDERPGSPQSHKTTRNAVTKSHHHQSQPSFKITKKPSTGGIHAVKSAGKISFKMNKRPVKSSKKNRRNSTKKVSVESTTNDPSMETQSLKVPASKSQVWLNDKWKVDTEMDHINNVRKMDGTNGNKSRPLDGPQMIYWETKYSKSPRPPQERKVTVDPESNPKWLMVNNTVNAFNEGSTGGPKTGSRFSNIAEYSRFPLSLSKQAKDEVMDIPDDFDVDGFLNEEEAVEKELLKSAEGQGNTAETEHSRNKGEHSVSKVKGKEHIKFPRTLKAHADSRNAEPGPSLMRRIEEKLSEDDFVLALGEDPGLEDLEWSEFIGPKSGLENDSDLTRLLGVQARQLSSMHNSCL